MKHIWGMMTSSLTFAHRDEWSVLVWLTSQWVWEEDYGESLGFTDVTSASRVLHWAAIKKRVAGGKKPILVEALAQSSSSCGDAVFKRIYSSSKAAADVHHGLEAGAVGCSPHGRCWWETYPASAPSQRWAPRLREAQQPGARTDSTSPVFSSQQTAALWRLRRWSCSEWRARRSSSPSRCSAECCRYAKSPPPGQTTPFRRAMGAGPRPMGTRSASCRATSSCGSFQWRLQTPGNTPVPTGTFA